MNLGTFDTNTELTVADVGLVEFLSSYCPGLGPEVYSHMTIRVYISCMQPLKMYTSTHYSKLVVAFNDPVHVRLECALSRNE